MNKQRKNGSWGLICLIAVFCGFISFAITINVYDKDIKTDEKIAMNVEKETTPKPGKNSILIPFQTLEDLELYEETPIETEIENEVNFVEPIVSEIKMPVTSFSPTLGEFEPDEEVMETVSKSIGENVDAEEKEIAFDLPFSGDIGMGYASKELIYSKTLDEWITHPGIDLLGKEAMPVKAMADGIIESIKLDPRYGNTIVIQHGGGYQSIYSNLSTIDLVYVGQKVKQGDIVSGIGKGFGFELEENSHVHVEVRLNGEPINWLN